MNIKQKICLLVGFLLASSLLIYSPVTIQMMNLRWWYDKTLKPTKDYTFHRFMPEGGLRVINWTVLSIEWLIIAIIVCLLIYMLRKEVKK